jgi:MATE family, multidrug efflux pump
MHDLTQGPIARHIVHLALPIAIGMVFQTLYQLIDLYFVAQLGDAAIAGVGAAGNVQFIIIALTQMLGVGTMALIAQASGRRDRPDANLVFNQSLLIAVVCAGVTLGFGYVLVGPYMQSLGADAATRAAGSRYLYWFLPGLALQFAMVVMGSALRGTGIARPTMIVQMLTVLLNIVLAPVLIAGWITHRPLGVSGAGLASTISICAGVALMWLYFTRLEKYVGFDRHLLAFRGAAWRRILGLGLPAGGEFVMMFLYVALIYFIIRDFGAEAQAGFGIGSRVMQALFVPALAVAFATGPIAGQNVGARNPARVRETLRVAALMVGGLMLTLTLVCQWRADLFVRIFTHDAAAIAVGSEYLTIISWNFVASGLILTCSGMFQALGNTWPSLLSSASRVVTFAVPAVLVAATSQFTLRELWLLSVASVALQAVLSLALVARELRQRMPMAMAIATP